MNKTERDRTVVKADEAVKLHPGDLDSTPVSKILCDPVQLTLNLSFPHLVSGPWGSEL